MMHFRLKLVSGFLLPVAFTSGHTPAPSDGAAAESAPAARVASVPQVASEPNGRAMDLLPARGVDVSRYQGRIDWNVVEDEGIRFAFVKATEGATYSDPTFRRNWAALGETRILRGAYHRFRAGRDAAAQAEHFLAVVRVADGDLPPVLDVESTDGVSDARLVRGVRTWLAVVERRTGMRPIVYTKPGFRRVHLRATVDDYPLWISEYGVESPSHPCWTFWQHSEQGRVPGIEKIVDLDRFNGSHAELRALAATGGTDRRLAER